MLTLQTNLSNFIGRLIFLALAFFIVYLLINFGLKDPGNGHTIFKATTTGFRFKVLYILYVLIACVIFLAVIIIVSLISINKIQIDTFSNTITFFSLFEEKVILTDDIEEYSETMHRNGFKEFHGLLIKLKNRKTIQVAGQNVNP